MFSKGELWHKAPRAIFQRCDMLCPFSALPGPNVTSQNKALIAAIAALVLAIAAAVGARLWLGSNPSATVTAPLDAACDLQAGPCSSAIPGGGRIKLSIAPHPIPLLRPLNLTVTVEGLDARMVEVDFVGVDMNMGYNRHQLKAQSDGQYSGEATLPVCITGRMAWQASVIVTTGKTKAVAPFRFITSHD